MKGSDIHGQPIVILRHTSCIVRKWELSDAEGSVPVNAEHMLSHLPRFIYIPVPGATWQIRDDLPIGAFILRPQRKEWILNAATGSKVKRKGYPMVPDFARTAFMVQGENLDAELAECGDIFTPPSLSAAVIAYVILSRVKDAAGLLLLRAFSPVLFQMGPPAGPVSLLTWLRRLFPTVYRSSPVDKPNLTRVVEDYTHLTRTWDLERTIIKREGLLWSC